MNELTFIILKIVISVAAAVISAYIIPLIKEKIAEIKDRRLYDAVEKAVRAAEQIIKGSGMGHVKKDEVINYVTAWMLQHGITITQEQLDQLIEAAVFSMNKKEEERK